MRWTPFIIASSAITSFPSSSANRALDDQLTCCHHRLADIITAHTHTHKKKRKNWKKEGNPFVGESPKCPCVKSTLEQRRKSCRTISLCVSSLFDFVLRKPLIDVYLCLFNFKRRSLKEGRRGWNHWSGLQAFYASSGVCCLPASPWLEVSSNLTFWLEAHQTLRRVVKKAQNKKKGIYIFGPQLRRRYARITAQSSAPTRWIAFRCRVPFISNLAIRLGSSSVG